MTWLGADELDLLVLGSGVAGLSAAVRAADELALRVGVLTKAELSQAATRWAQGGVAAVLAGDPDSTDLHLADTLSAGAGLCDVDAVRVLVDEGPSRVNELIAMGAMFDRDREGRLQLAREGGHSLPRVVHAGGAATGAEIERALVEEVRDDRGRLLGAVVRPRPARRRRPLRGRRGDGRRTGRSIEIRARHVLLATGGAGPALRRDHQPAAVDRRRHGHGPAGRRGRAPTSSSCSSTPPRCSAPRCRGPLLSEALRGHGALIRDRDGERFVDELQPRDVVVPRHHRQDARAGRRPRAGSTPPASSASTSASPPSPPTSAAPGSIPAGTGSRSRPPPTTTAAASSPTSTAPRPSPACGPRARWRAPASTAPTAWLATRCWRAWCSAPASIEAIGRGVDGPVAHGCHAGRRHGRSAAGDVIGGRSWSTLPDVPHVPSGRPTGRGHRGRAAGPRSSGR